MAFITTMKLDRPSAAIADGDRASRLNDEKLIVLSCWLMVLGTVRFLCTFSDYASAFSNAYRFDSVSPRMLAKFFDENQPILALSSAWPLVLGIALRRTRWPELLPAAAVTLLILSLGGLMELLAEWNHSSADGITFGSFHMTRRAILRPTFSDVILILLGTGQLILECATALRCSHLAHAFRGARAHPTEPGRQERSRRARRGRLAVYASLGFLVLMIRLPVWSMYLEILSDSRIVREFVLRNDFMRLNAPARVHTLTPTQERQRALQVMLSFGHGAATSDRFLEAKEYYLQIIARAESADEKALPAGSRSVVAEAQNNLAWLLATCPKAELRNPPEAVDRARRAVASQPNEGNFWNTLGVAYYRNGEWNDAKDALHRSIALRGEGDSFDWFFLALVHLKQGRPEQARQWYEKAVQWYHDSRPADRELHRFHAEAAHEFGLPAPAPLPRSIAGKRRLPANF